jgi:threonine dehydratase
MISKDDILIAHKKIENLVHRTPVFTCATLNRMSGAQLFFKCENLQKVGAFKARGASHALECLSREQLDKGVATHSSGNHGQAIAWAAQNKGVKAYIVMPEAASKVKIDAVRGYGAVVIFSENSQSARESTLQEIVERTGATFIHPYNHIDVIKGQATAALELLEVQPDLDYVVAPVGGGGLLAGSSLSVKYFSANAKTLGAEPANADDCYRSLQAGKIMPMSTTQTIADGLRTQVGEVPFPILLENVEEILLAQEEDILPTMKLVWERMKIIIEPSCAVPLAAILRQKKRFEGKKIGIILSGGNVDFQALGLNL